MVPSYEIYYTVDNVNASPLASATIAILHDNQLATIGDSTLTYLD